MPSACTQMPCAILRAPPHPEVLLQQWLPALSSARGAESGLGSGPSCTGVQWRSCAWTSCPGAEKVGTTEKKVLLGGEMRSQQVRCWPCSSLKPFKPGKGGNGHAGIFWFRVGRKAAYRSQNSALSVSNKVAWPWLKNQRPAVSGTREENQSTQ